MNILYDADIFLYEWCRNCQQILDFGEQQILVGDSREARQKMENDLVGIQHHLEKWLGTKLNPILCFSGPDNWRKKVYPEYKSNRIGGLKPTSFKAVRDWFLANWPCKVEYGLEADDVLGILSTTDENDNIIVSEDKDLRTIPGFLFNPKKDTNPVLISLAQADYNHMYQTLTGDTTDGYKGIPGVGPKGAIKVLGTPGQHTTTELWEKVCAAYKASGMTYEQAVVQATVARILRKDEWNYETKACLWKPPVQTRIAQTEVQ